MKAEGGQKEEPNLGVGKEEGWKGRWERRREERRETRCLSCWSRRGRSTASSKKEKQTGQHLKQEDGGLRGEEEGESGRAAVRILISGNWPPREQKLGDGRQEEKRGVHNSQFLTEWYLSCFMPLYFLQSFFCLIFSRSISLSLHLFSTSNCAIPTFPKQYLLLSANFPKTQDNILCCIWHTRHQKAISASNTEKFTTVYWGAGYIKSVIWGEGLGSRKKGVINMCRTYI